MIEVRSCHEEFIDLFMSFTLNDFICWCLVASSQRRVSMTEGDGQRCEKIAAPACQPVHSATTEGS